jgi:CubicO group peptidase (beta-lactamase class C family)
MRLRLPALLVLLAAGPAAAQELPAVTERMRPLVASHDIAGAVTAVGRKDAVLHLAAVGVRDLASGDPMRPDALFRIASMTKPVTAIGVMILADRGKLSPLDPVEKHLPEFRGQMLVEKRTGDAVTLRKPARPITLADLLTHTSGLSPYPPGIADVYTKRNRTLAETTAAVSQMPLLFEPGTKWAYSNSGMDTLGRVIEVVSGERYEDFLKANVFDPLGMADTTFYPTDDQLKRLAATYDKKGDTLIPAAGLIIDLAKEAKHPVPAGGLFSSAADLCRLYRMMLNKGQLDGKRVLSEAAVAEMTRVQTRDIKTGFVDGMGFGYGWAVVREPKGVTAALSAGTFGHGGAFGTQAWVDPTKDLFVLLLIQRTGLPNADGSPMRQALQEAAVAAVR